MVGGWRARDGTGAGVFMVSRRDTGRPTWTLQMQCRFVKLDPSAGFPKGAGGGGDKVGDILGDYKYTAVRCSPAASTGRCLGY